MSKIQTEKYIICPICKGSGHVQCSEIEDYHHNTYEYWDLECSNCDGQGRLVETTLIYTRKLTKEDLKIRERKKG
jgi:hypothetical protein